MNRRIDMPVERDEVIVTDRCRLRYPVESDIPHIWSACQTPTFNDGLPWGPPASIAEIDEPFRAAQARWVSGDEYSFAIDARATREFVGWISIRHEAEAGAWSIGFWVHPRQQGQGFATECAAAMLDFGFKRLNAKLITAAHAARNTASARVLQKIGMQYIRTNPLGFYKNDEWVEECEYAIQSEQAIVTDDSKSHG